MQATLAMTAGRLGRPDDLADLDWLVRKLAIRFGASPTAPRDAEVYSDGWLGLLNADRTFRPGAGATFGGHAIRCIRSRIIDGLRRRHGLDDSARRLQGPMLFSQIGDGTRRNDPPAPARDPIDFDVIDAVRREVGRLTPHYRDAVIAVDLEGLEYHEAAERLAVPIGTIKSRLNAARARLRERLARFADVA